MNGAPVLDGWRRARGGLDRLRPLALSDPALFNAMVLRDETTGGPISLAPMHEAWHDLISQHDRTVIWSHTEAGKSQQVSIGRTLYELGRDHGARIAIVSNTHAQAAKLIRSIAKYIESSGECRAITGLRPGDPWSSHQLYVQRPHISKDPSVQACGIGGNIMGSRVDFLILDDVLDYENCRTADQRKKLIEWYDATLSGRLTERARVCVVGTAFNPDDLLHNLARRTGFHAVRYPVVDEVTGVSRWPERWNPARIQKAREDRGPIEFARQMLCRPRTDDEAVFRWEWIAKCLARGNGRRMAYGLQSVPPGCRVVTGVDLGVQQSDSADLTVLFTVIIHPDETREVLSIESGRWNGPDIVGRIIDAHRRYQSIVVVENNAAQDYIRQFARGQSAVPIRGYTTGRTKAHPEFGVQSIATEMSLGKWIIPCDGDSRHPEVDAWLNDMLYFDAKAHTGDRLMASFFAREGAKMTGQKASVGKLDLQSR